MRKIKKQRNTHARSKKNKVKMMAKERHMKLMEQHLSLKRSTPGQIAQMMKRLSMPTVIITRAARFGLRGTLNQRQKRKLWRQLPYMRRAS